MNLMDNVRRMPKSAIEFCILMPLILVFSYMDDIYLFKTPFIELMIIYGVCWFTFRIIFSITLWFSYNILEILTPIYFLGATLILMIVVHHINPSYNIGPIETSQEEMAKDCSEARWAVFIEYLDGNSGGGDSFHVSGNTHDAQIKGEEGVARWIKNHPNLVYRWHNITLYHLPKDYVRSHRYPSHLFETTDLDGNTLMSGASNGMR